MSNKKYETTAIVQEKIWGPDDTYLIVEVQVSRSDGFKKDDNVKVTIEKE